MEFNEKLQELRKQKGLTQEQLAEALFVSRTAISKWESGRGYPSIESLKAISKYFSVTIDQLLSGEEVLTIAQEDTRQKQTHLRDLVFGLLDCSSIGFFFLPFFGQSMEGSMEAVSLLGLTHLQPWLKGIYFAVIMAMILVGVLTLAVQNHLGNLWNTHKKEISLLCNALCVFLFIITRQPYAAGFTFIFLAMKTIMLLKKQ